MSVYIELDKENLSLVLTAGGAQVHMDALIYPKAKEWILAINEADLKDTSLQNLAKMKGIVWRLRDLIRERLSTLDTRDPDYEVLETNIKTINQANYYLFVALSKKSQGEELPVFDELLVEVNYLN